MIVIAALRATMPGQGLDTLDIMAISGHKTETSFLKYIKVTREQRAKRIALHPFFQS